MTTLENLDDIVQNEILPRFLELREYFCPELIRKEETAETGKRERDEKKIREDIHE